MESSEEILERFRRLHPQDISLTLRTSYYSLLEKLGSPHLHLPPTFHIAGTNGKGSTCAFLRAFLEAAGYRVHVYTSPHLVSFHERIRVAGLLIKEAELIELLRECEHYAEPGSLSYFEIATAIALTSFARRPADFTILEVGLGGRLDATNVIPRPLATIITRLSFDHRDYLGDSMTSIANEKAGILRKNVPCYSPHQPSKEALQALRLKISECGASLFLEGEDWFIKVHDTGFHFEDKSRSMDLPSPALLGYHQYYNAGLAIAALSILPNHLDRKHIARGLLNAYWPARLQALPYGPLTSLVPASHALWLDGGHNDSAGEVLAVQAKTWSKSDGQPLYIICGMLTSKRPDEFLTPLCPFVTAIRTVSIPAEPKSFSALELAQIASHVGITDALPASSIQEAIKDLVSLKQPGRILICGSLYLAGYILRENETIEKIA